MTNDNDDPRHMHAESNIIKLYIGHKWCCGKFACHFGIIVIIAKKMLLKMTKHAIYVHCCRQLLCPT